MVNKDHILEAFAGVLKQQRIAKGLSQEKLAERADLDRSYISELERGIKTPTIVTIFKLSDGLVIEPSRLIELIEQEAKS